MILEHETTIDAPPRAVWDVTVDVVRWPEWTPTVKHVRPISPEPLAVGSVVELVQPGLPPTPWTVTEIDAPRRFTWTARLPGLRMAATHELAAEGDGTRNTLRVDASGWLVTLLYPVLRWSIGRALRRENAGLRARCEATQRGL